MRLPQIVALLCDVLVEKDADAMSSALKCLETLVAWAPLKGYVTRDLLRTSGAVDRRGFAIEDVLRRRGGARVGCDSLKNLIPDIRTSTRSATQHRRVVGALRSAQVGAGQYLGLLRTLASALDSYTDEEDQEDVFSRDVRAGEYVRGAARRAFQQRPDFPVAELFGLLARVLFSRAANPRTLRRNLRPWDTLVSVPR